MFSIPQGMYCNNLRWCVLTQGNPRVQFADIRKIFLCQDLPEWLQLWVDVCVVRHAISLKSILVTTKFWKLFWTCDQFFIPTSNFSDFCYPNFFYQTLIDGVILANRAFAVICDHSLFTCQSSYIEKLPYRSTGGGGGPCSHKQDGSPLSWFNVY